VFCSKIGGTVMVAVRPVSGLQTRFEENQFAFEIYEKLKESEIEARLSPDRLRHDDVFSELRKKILNQGNYAV
jgi:hypothetical protein